MRLSTHSQRLERWLGPVDVEQLSRNMRGWYGPPVPLGGVPGLVYATGDGDFVGAIRGGYHASVADYVASRAAAIARRFARRQLSTMHAGFSSLSDLIAEATANDKAQEHLFSKLGTTQVAGAPHSLWNVGPLPAAGGTGGTSGTGRECTRSTTGALGQSNPTGGDTLHLVTATVHSSGTGALAIYDRLWDMTYNHASSTSTAIDSANRPQRYQTAGLAPGNFVGGEVTTTLSANNHTVTITYVDDAGNTAEAASAYTQAQSTAVNQFWAANAGQTWFVPLNSGDRGLRYLTNIAQNTTASVTGVQNFWIGHMLGIVPCPIANVAFVLDGINSAFNLVRIYDDACIAFFNMPATGTTAQRFEGLLKLVAG